MSMLGMAYLSEIFNRINNEDFTAGHILNQLRKRIKSIFRQDRRQDNFANAMDMALCIIDIETKKMDYAGAYRPLYIVRYNEQSKQNELIKYKADKMPIAAHIRENPFTNIEKQLKADDTIYLFSDGYTDQFGGEKDKKFFSEQFVILLLEISSESMTKQKDILSERFYQWKSEERQVDDVLVIGIKISDVYGEVDFFNDF